MADDHPYKLDCLRTSTLDPASSPNSCESLSESSSNFNYLAAHEGTCKSEHGVHNELRNEDKSIKSQEEAFFSSYECILDGFKESGQASIQSALELETDDEDGEIFYDADDFQPEPWI